MLVGLVSIFRIGYLMLHHDKPRGRFIRPTMAAGICVMAMLHTHLSLVPARKLATDTASWAQAQCEERRSCPAAIEGWQPRHDSYSSQTRSGRWVKWPVLYRSDGKRFVVRLYKFLDVGETWAGGVARKSVVAEERSG